MFSLFRALSFAEGVSYVMILSISMGLLSRDYVSMIGMTHGILFMIYLVLLALVSEKEGWSKQARGGLFIASIVPFAFIRAELFLRKSSVKNDSLSSTS
ncbi:hypothetical protein OA92_20500 [Marinomonas sp. SBI22]|uniref:DUF3817 domain-containing protein n=1 Tax=unclassified Marinomonas TaxID=196814 RepID=UPI0007AFB4DF|nr:MULTISPECIES: DUF3817 domain-containing protein [unclassified Marinomonas]KZM39276.1 hypothetical protein OA92_20500 [Marinomonas sp. SBI22]KZM40177.1 hypothetical protein OA91_20360 [Marinomonas sp. SBI8L]